MSAAAPTGPDVSRPPVSVILPFHGDAEEADTALEALARLELRDGDEVLVADNTQEGVLLARPGAAAVDAFASPVKQSAYAARNLAAERARNEWLLLLDADCVPRPDLLDRYFDPAPTEAAGAVAGQVLGLPGQPGVVPRYIRARRHLDQVWLRDEHPYRPMAVTANLLVRRAALADVGGFAEQTRSGADSEFCWRLQDAGWELELREEALVHHVHRASLPALLRQSARDGAGGRWASRRYEGHPARPVVTRELVRSAGGAAVWLARGRGTRAVHKLIDGAWVVAAAWGSLQSNASPVTAVPQALSTVVVTGAFPEPGAPELGLDPATARIEAAGRPERTDWTAGRRFACHFQEDDGPAVRARALARLAARRPGAVAAELRRDRDRAARLAPAALRLAADPAHVDVTAAAGSEDDAAALARLASRPWRRAA